MASLLQWLRSTEVNQTLHYVWPSPGLVRYIYTFGICCPPTEFCHVQNSLCVHLRTIAQVSRAISSQVRHLLTIWKELTKQQYLPYIAIQYGELRPTRGWDLLASLRHQCKFQHVSRLGSVTARQSSSGRQPNFAPLNRGSHLYSAWRPSRWAFAHILVITGFHFYSYSKLDWVFQKRTSSFYRLDVFPPSSHRQLRSTQGSWEHWC